MTERALITVGRWAIVLQSAQRTIPGVRSIDRPKFFVGSYPINIDALQPPHLYATREMARNVLRLTLQPRFAAAGLRAKVVPVRVSVQEMPTLECAAGRDER